MRTLRSWTIACAISLAAATAAGAQTAPAAPSGGTYTPQSGQAGKDVVWVPSAQALVDRMLDMAGLNPSDYLIDLGSGDGRTVITAAQRGTKALGVEFNPDLVKLSQQAIRDAGVADRATIVQGDIFETDFSQATVLTLFLLPSLNMKLRPTILTMKPGTRIVTNTFTMDDWKADRTIDAGGECTSFCKAHLWIVPAKVGGTWREADGELKLAQRFQEVTGTLSRAGKAVPISEGRLNGAELAFVADGVRYRGTVDGTRMEVTAENGTRQTWTGTLGDG